MVSKVLNVVLSEMESSYFLRSVVQMPPPSSMVLSRTKGGTWSVILKGLWRALT